MGVKIPAGIHTRQATSPPGEPHLETATDSGTTHNGVWYAWNATTGRYQARIPPPPTNPPGEWRHLEFDAEEGLMVYQTMDTGSVVPIEHGRDVWNGPLV